MLKRIKDRFSQTKDVKILSEFGYRPSEEELETGMSFSKISALKRKYAFEGEFHCKLCPKKLLNCRVELEEHLKSKGHAKNVTHYFRKNKGELNKQITKLFESHSIRIKKYSPRFR